MSATFFGGEVKYTSATGSDSCSSTLTRHFLLMTATPHNGKEEDFQLFMALLDGDRFEGRFRDGVHTVRCLGPDAPDGQGGAAQVRRHAAVPGAHRLHGALQAVGRRGRTSTRRSPTTSGRSSIARRRCRTTSEPARSALRSPILQRRLASSPEAIYQSLRRRRERLEKRLREEKLLQRGADAGLDAAAATRRR